MDKFKAIEYMLFCMMIGISVWIVFLLYKLFEMVV